MRNQLLSVTIVASFFATLFLVPQLGNAQGTSGDDASLSFADVQHPILGGSIEFNTFSSSSNGINPSLDFLLTPYVSIARREKYDVLLQPILGASSSSPSSNSELRDNTFTVGLGLQFRSRVYSYQKFGFFLLHGPSLSYTRDWTNFNNPAIENETSDLLGINYGIGVQLGYDIMPRIRVLTTVVTANLNGLFVVDGDTSFGINARTLAAGPSFAVEYLLKSKK